MKPVYLVTFRGKYAVSKEVKGAALAFGTLDAANDFIDVETKRQHTSRRHFKVLPFRRSKH